jgi:hypothetical protein
MSNFDPASFLFATTEEASSTQSVPVPVGEYPAIITKVDARPWNSKDGTKSGLALDIIYELDDDALKTLLDRQKITVKQGIMLDMTDNGGLDNGKGKNVTLGRLREAVNQNTPGKPWSPSMLEGQICKVAVKHRVVEDNIYSEVGGTLRLA